MYILPGSKHIIDRGTAGRGMAEEILCSSSTVVCIQTQNNLFLLRSLGAGSGLIGSKGRGVRREESVRLTLRLLGTDSQVDGSPVRTCHMRR
jgi:hypothetical protein